MWRRNCTRVTSLNIFLHEFLINRILYYKKTTIRMLSWGLICTFTIMDRYKNDKIKLLILLVRSNQGENLMLYRSWCITIFQLPISNCRWKKWMIGISVGLTLHFKSCKTLELAFMATPFMVTLT